MTEIEIKTLQELARQLMPAGVVITIETPGFKESIIEAGYQLVVFDISDGRDENDGSKESIIAINGDADIVGRSWIWPVDMVIIFAYRKDILEKYIDTWRPRIVDQGIMVFGQYGYPGLDFVKPVVDEKMADCEQIAAVDYLVAYRIRDEVTRVSWNMMENAYSHNGVSVN